MHARSLIPKTIVFEESWAELLEIIQGVITLNRLRKIDKPLWQNTFFDVHKLCTAHPEPFCEQMYKKTRQYLQSHISIIHNVDKTPSAKIGLFTCLC